MIKLMPNRHGTSGWQSILIYSPVILLIFFAKTNNEKMNQDEIFKWFMARMGGLKQELTRPNNKIKLTMNVKRQDNKMVTSKTFFEHFRKSTRWSQLKNVEQLAVDDKFN